MASVAVQPSLLLRPLATPGAETFGLPASLVDSMTFPTHGAALLARRGIGAAFLVACLLPASSSGQSIPSASGAASRSVAQPPAKPAKPTRWQVRVGTEVEYDDNVFLLAATRKTDLGTPSGSALASGRFTDMTSASDVITNVSAAAALRTRGAFGRALDLQPSVAYQAYAQNGARSNVTVGFAAEQDLRRGGRFRVRGGLTPSYYARNYLADATDGDANGRISARERVYRAGTYREADVSADYRIRLARSTRRSPSGAALQVGAGYYGRTFEAPFAGRDLRGPSVGVKLVGEVTRRVGVDLAYGWESLRADVLPQVMILDEGDVGRDLNGNGTASDRDVRVEDQADRSRREQAVGARLRMEAGKRTDLTVDAKRRWRAFTSDQPLDAANNGRQDARDQVGAELTTALRPGLRFTARGSYARQALNRSVVFGNTGEINDYSRIRLAAGLRYTF